MNLGIEPTDIFRLSQIACNIAKNSNCSISEAIDHIEAVSDGPIHNPDVLDFARTARRFRQKRNQQMGAPLFRDPAWDMLLDLLLTEGNGNRRSVTALCHGSGVAMTTALRYVQRLEDHGLVTREDDMFDQRRSFLTLSPAAKQLLVELLSDWQRESAASHSASVARYEKSDVGSGDGAKRRPSAVHPVFLS